MNTPSPRPVPLGLKPSFGYGDRIGLATPGHVLAAKEFGGDILPIFPQQSIREMTRTQRSAKEVMGDALRGMLDAGWDGPTGADADHLKNEADVDVTVEAGFTFFTIDPSDFVDEKADGYDLETLSGKFEEVAPEIDWISEYKGKSVTLGNGTVIEFEVEAVQRAAVKYGRALVHARKLADYIRKVTEAKGQEHEIEVSVDETEQPTTLAEHYIIADQLIRHNVNLVSLAPRFIGELEKGVDYIGDVTALEKSMADHNAVSEALGPYKLSLHSGSDKLSMYTPFARATRGRFHVKTAGTSYLEAIRVAAKHDEALFRKIIDISRASYERDKATYHVHATLADAPETGEVTDTHVLEQQYLECWEDVPEGLGFTAPGRQILHCCFGTVLTHPELGPALKNCLAAHPDTYAEVLRIHFGKHLDALKKGI